MSEKLVTLDLLKAFGDKSKKIFRPTTVLNPEGYLFLKVETIVPSLVDWTFNTELWAKGKLVNFTYSGNLKATITACNNVLYGHGAIYYGSLLKGIAFIVDLEYVTLIFEFEENSVAEAVVDILNYKDNNGCNIVNKAEFIPTITEYKDSITYHNILGTVLDIIGNMGNLNSLLFNSANGLFQIRVPSKTSLEDTAGVISKIPINEYTINKVNASKWADYLLQPHTVKLNGDIKETSFVLGGGINTSIGPVALEINNQVENFSDEWFNSVKVNSKGLVVSVEKTELPKASETTPGIVLTGYEENLIEKKYPVKVDNAGNAYVHVPWNDTDTWNKVATNDDLGLIQIGFLEKDKKYPVKLDSDNKAYVEVPWEPGETTFYDLATKDVAGLIKVGYKESSTRKAVRLNDNGEAYVLISPSITLGFSDYVTIDTNTNSDYFYYLPTIIGSGKYHFASDYLDSEWETIDTFTINLHAISLLSSSACTKIVRFENPYSDKSINIKVVKGDDVRVCNMFDSTIMGEGIILSPGKTIELTFTYWESKNVTFRGDISK